MRLNLLVLVSVVLFFSVSTSAHACSCMDHMSIEEQIEATALVFEGEALETVPDDSLGTHYNSITTFRVSNVLKGKLPERIDIVHRLGHGASCALSFTPQQTALVFAHKMKDGRFATGACSKGYGFTDDQIKEYLTSGQDVLRLSRMCRYDFMDANKNLVFTRELKLHNPKCMQVKHLYDREHPLSPLAAFMDNKPVHPTAHYWSELYHDFLCKKQGTKTVESLSNIPTYLLDELEKDISDMSAKEISSYASLISKKRKTQMDMDTRDKLTGYLYAKAAAQGDPGAMNKLGDGALKCKYQLKQDTDSAARWFTKAIEGGNKQAYENLAWLHLAGMTDAVDPERTALDLLDKCKNSNRQSCRNKYDWLKQAIDGR